MPEIGSAEIARAYELGCQCFTGRLTEAEAIDRLIIELSMNRSSAGAYVRAVRHMLRGEVYKRMISVEAARYYLGNIQADFGDKAASNALKSYNAHIAYLEQRTRVPRPAFRKLAFDYGSRLALDWSLQKVLSDLDVAVAKARSLPPTARRKLLPPPGTKPKAVSVQTRVFIRDPNVIVEVLARSNRVCEGCKKPAPFSRRSDKTPHLEVHHQIRLADGGDDTVQNALALCPNCHRRLHFG